MRLALAVEMRRLQIIEEQLAILEREAAEVADALISDTRDGHPTISLRWVISTIQADVRNAITEWDAAKRRISQLDGEPPARRGHLKSRERDPGS